MSIQILDNTGQTNGAAVTAEHHLSVTGPLVEDESGFVSLSGESHSGLDGGMARRNRALEVSADFRLRTGSDTFLFKDTFSHTVVNTSKYRVVNTTMTNALSGGRWVFNSSLSTASSVGTLAQTYATFSLGLSGSMYIDFEVAMTEAPQTNNICEFGVALATGITAPTDGALFRLNAAGTWEGVINNNSAETVVMLLATAGSAYSAGINVMHHYKIGLHNDVTDFWVNDVLYGTIPTPAGIGSPLLSMSAPLFMRMYNTAAVLTAQQMLVANCSVATGDLDTVRLWPTVNVVMGNSCYNAPDGSTAGSTGSYVFGTAPVVVAAASQLSSTACYTTLGGQFSLGTIGSAETEVLVFSYLNPAQTTVIPGKNLIINRVTIDACNLGVVGSAVGVVQQWSLAVGSTQVSATTESAIAGTRGGRRVPLGLICLGASAAVGARCQGVVDINLDTPVVVEPGTYLNIFMKPISGPSNAGQITRGTCFVNGYFE
jgi:hypothetical protein